LSNGRRVAVGDAFRFRQRKKINKICGVNLLTLSPPISILLSNGRPGVNAKRPAFRFFLHFFKNFSTKRRSIGKHVKMRSLRRVVKTVRGGGESPSATVERRFGARKNGAALQTRKIFYNSKVAEKV
jgi:hypothetical protein